SSTLIPPHLRSTLFPYTTLFRSLQSGRFYQSLVPLEGETLEQIFQHYLSQSEQLPAYLRLYADDDALCGLLLEKLPGADSRDPEDRKSTRLNSSHLGISYAVFCL